MDRIKKSYSEVYKNVKNGEWAVLNVTSDGDKLIISTFAQEVEIDGWPTAADIDWVIKELDEAALF